ncbi:rhomboid family intramembrane serine protease, partial [Lysobacter sp. 2RAB21]
LGGAVAGVIGAFVFKLSDPLPPRKRYSWEDEEDAEMVPVNDELEPPSPRRVPVLWNRPDPRDVQSGVVLRFPGRGDSQE